MSFQYGPMLSACIFARNEERLLPQCVGSLMRSGLERRDEVHILINGSADNTALTARTLSAADPRICVHELPVGDKANAWNEYVHRIAPAAAGAHVFIDGDIAASPDALTALDKALAASPESYAAAALPASGRSRRAWARSLIANHYLSGNLYALSADALAAFREKRIRLPFGAKGEDGLLSYLLLTDLKGGTDDSHKRRIVIAEDATFEFESLRPTMRDLGIYARRLLRYSERHFQKKILYRILKEKGVRAMPEAVSEIYTQDACKALRPRVDPVNFWFDLAILRRLKANAAVLAEAR